VLDALISFFSSGLGNDHYLDNIFEFRIQKIEKIAKMNAQGQSLLPFFITIKRTLIPQDPKI